MFEEEVEAAARLLAGSRHAVAFTGAGISTESGIPDFRGPRGLWKQLDPMKVAHIETFRRDPRAFWEFAAGRNLSGARPNAGHRCVAELEEMGVVRAVVTQNVDGLHQEAGSKRVIELHGTTKSASCLACGRRFPREEVVGRVRDGENPPKCGCGGLLKPDTVLFGEPLPSDALRRAFAEAESCDLMLVLGSSLVVYPAASIPEAAANRGAPVVLVNGEPTEKDWMAEVVMHAKIGEVMPRVVERVRALRSAKG